MGGLLASLKPALDAAAAAQATANNALSGAFYGQAVVDVTASRALGVNYTNTTGKPIVVMVSGHHSVSSSNVVYTVGGLSCYGPYIQSVGAISGVAFVVPAGAMYQVSSINAIDSWRELR